MSSFCEMAAQLQDPEAIHQPSPPHPQQFALQTLPQRVHAAAAAGYVLDATDASSSDSSSSDSELDSNQFEAAEDSLASLTRRKAREPSGATPSTPWQQHLSPLRAPGATPTITSATALRANTSDRGSQQPDSHEPSGSNSNYATAMATASLHLERLEAMAHDLQTTAARKHHARSPSTNAGRLQSSANSAATVIGDLYHPYEQMVSASPAVPARPASPSDPYEATLAQSLRRHAAVRMDDAAIQDEIRSVLAQTEQLLVAAQAQSQAHRDAEDASDSDASSTHSELSDGEMDHALQHMQASPLMRRRLQHEAAQSVGPRSEGAQAPDLAPLVDDPTNRAINATKARALEVSMLSHLLRLGFHEDLTRRALDAGVHEIAHFDADCELAYVDIFLSLVRMVCDAHADARGHRAPASGPTWIAPEPLPLPLSTFALDRVAMDAPQHDASDSSTPFKWPVFDMAQFEFGNARPGTCFDSVCVLTNLPKVALDRTDELLEALASHLFRMLGDPIQVVIPSASATGRTKGHAFLEFDDHALARACAVAIDGLQWGRGPFGRIRSRLFREYHVKVSPPPTQAPLQSSARARAVSSALVPGGDRATRRLNGRHFGHEVDDNNDENGDEDSLYARDASDASLQNPFVERSWHDDALVPPAGDGRLRRQSLFADSVYTSSEDGEGDGCHNDEDDDDDGHLLWRPRERERLLLDLSEQLRTRVSRPVLIDELEPDMDSSDDSHVVLPNHDDVFETTSLLPPYAARAFHRMRQSQCSSNDDDECFGARSRGVDDDDDDDDDDHSWGCDSVLDLSTSDPRSRLLRQHYAQSPSASATTAAAPGPAASAIFASHKPGATTSAPAPSPPSHRAVAHPSSIDASEKPWRSYCEELIARNREMQEQVAYARRRIVQLGHNNQKLHLLIDRVERDRDGLAFENDVLQTQLQGVADHEQQHAALLAEVAMLRKRLRKTERSSDGCSAPLESVRTALQHDLSASALGRKDTDELRDWEQVLESALARVRVTKETQALARQKELDRQVEAQQELKLCVICLANDKTILCLPCRHLCLCEACSAHEEVEKCPICRLHIDEMLQVYA